MALFKDLQYFNGKINTKDGVVGTPTGSTLAKREKGYALKTGLNEYVTYGSQLLPDGAFTVVIYAKLKPTHVLGTDRVANISTNTSATRGFVPSYSNYGGKSVITLGNNTYRIFNYIPDKNWHCYIITLPGIANTDINNCILKVDNITQTVFSTASVDAQDARSLFKITGGGNNASGGCYISRIKIFDTVLSDTEQTKEYNEYLNLIPYFEQNTGFNTEKPTEYIEAGKLAHYVFSPETVSNGTLLDISSNANHVALSNVLLSKDGCRFNGTTSYGNVTGSNGLAGDITICGRFNAKGWGGGGLGRIFQNSKLILRISDANMVLTREGVVEIASAAASISLNQDYNFTITSTSTGVTNFYINGILSGTANQTAGTPESSTAWYVGNRASNDRAFDGTIQDLRIYNYIYSTFQITTYYNSFRKLLYHNDFSNSAVGNFPKDTIDGTATSITQELSAFVDKDLDIGHKWCKTTTAGTNTIPINLDAYVGNGYIKYKYFNGTTWTTRSGLINTPVSGAAYSGGILTLTTSSNNHGYTNIEIWNQQ